MQHFNKVVVIEHNIPCDDDSIVSLIGVFDGHDEAMVHVKGLIERNGLDFEQVTKANKKWTLEGECGSKTVWEFVIS